jgi:carboxyl-terminal processing protease
VLKRGLIFDYATNFVSRHQNIDSAWAADNQTVDDFKNFIQSKNFVYTSLAEQDLDDLTNYSKRNNYKDKFVDKLLQLRSDLAEEKNQDFENSRALIRITLEQEILSRYFGNKARFMAGFKYDKAYNQAVNVLRDREKYKHILAGK